MNVALLAIAAFFAFYLAYRYYSTYIQKTLGEDDSRQTPAHTMKDGVDYVPAHPLVLFSHHFASIAGSGPIVGPTLAVAYGYMPVLFWIILGSIFFGAVHDYTSLFISMREKGKSMAQVAHGTLGRVGYMMFIVFTLVLIFLVTSAFLGLTATALSSMVPVKSMQVDPANTVLKIVEKNGQQMAAIGGIASTSVIVMTLFSPLLGYMLYRKGIKVQYAVIMALTIGVGSILVGLAVPVALDPKPWMAILTVYVFLAAGIPVWALLQPRDFTNSFLLYIGITILVIGAFVGGASGVSLQYPAWNIDFGTQKLGMVWPFLFITVACGAISGFHSLVSGGTSSKQINKESDSRRVGYGGMLLEGTLAVLVVIAVAGGISFNTYADIVFPKPGTAPSNPILAFSLGMGGLMNQAVGLPIAVGTIFGILMCEGFIITTLDSAVRLNRYLFEELWSNMLKEVPSFMKTFWFNSLLSVLIMLYLAWTNAFLAIWPIFGSANQLLSGLALIAASMWLLYRGKPTWFTIIPAGLMMCTTMYALYTLLVTKYIPSNNIPLIITDMVLLVLGLGVIILTIQRYVTVKNQRPPVTPSV